MGATVSVLAAGAQGAWCEGSMSRTGTCQSASPHDVRLGPGRQGLDRAQPTGEKMVPCGKEQEKQVSSSWQRNRPGQRPGGGEGLADGQGGWGEACPGHFAALGGWRRSQGWQGHGGEERKPTERVSVMKGLAIWEHAQDWCSRREGTVSSPDPQ
jgi:hypothetical protein